MADPDTHGDAREDTLRKQFESAWSGGHPEPIERFLPAEEDAGYLAALIARQAQDGQPPESL